MLNVILVCSSAPLAKPRVYVRRAAEFSGAGPGRTYIGFRS